MEETIYCLVDPAGKVYASNDARSYGEVASAFDLDEAVCQRFRFELPTRRLIPDRGTTVAERAVRRHLERSVGSPEQLMRVAGDGGLTKRALASLLASDRRLAYAETCAAIEKTYTDECAPTSGACLESGCAADGEICLQPLLQHEAEYRRACGSAWLALFADPRNRIEAWRR
jgi:hypothetical protein